MPNLVARARKRRFPSVESTLSVTCAAIEGLLEGLPRRGATSRRRRRRPRQNNNDEGQHSSDARFGNAGLRELDCESPTAKAGLRRPDYETVRAQSSCDDFAVPEPESEAPELAFPSVAGSQRCACDDSFVPDVVPDVVPDGRRLNTFEVALVSHGSGLRWCSSHPMPHSEQVRSGPKRCPEAVGRSVDCSRLKCPVSPDFVDPKNSRSELSATSAASVQSVRIGQDRFHDGQNCESIAGHRVGRADAVRNPG